MDCFGRNCIGTLGSKWLPRICPAAIVNSKREHLIAGDSKLKAISTQLSDLRLPSDSDTYLGILAACVDRTPAHGRVSKPVTSQYFAPQKNPMPTTDRCQPGTQVVMFSSTHFWGLSINTYVSRVGNGRQLARRSSSRHHLGLQASRYQSLGGARYGFQGLLQHHGCRTRR